LGFAPQAYFGNIPLSTTEQMGRAALSFSDLGWFLMAGQVVIVSSAA
jgi:hypothetical protein